MPSTPSKKRRGGGRAAQQQQQLKVPVKRSLHTARGKAITNAQVVKRFRQKNPIKPSASTALPQNSFHGLPGTDNKNRPKLSFYQSAVRQFIQFLKDKEEQQQQQADSSNNNNNYGNRD